jgi:hypothetical protein
VKKIISVSVLLAVLLVSLAPAPAAQAATNMVGNCPPGFGPMGAMEHDMMEHKHAGIKADLNGDGVICMSMATETIHVHVDNYVMAP